MTPTLVGQVVDGHELVRVLAAGGMGEVYLARHLRLGLMRAIKVIHDDVRDDPTAAERFHREAQVLSRLQHNSIVQIIDFGELANGWPFLAMEYIDGPNLDAVIDAGGPMAMTTAVEVLSQIAEALLYAHRQQVVHRDLKPANVLLRAGDPRQVKVIDFGLAILATGNAIRLTADGQVMGSPLYMAPEQAHGRREVTHAADTYSLAGVAYLLISGEPPFGDRPLLDLLDAHVKEAPERLSARCPRPGLTPLLDELLLACLAKDPDDRPQLDEVAAHLARMTRSANAPAGGDDRPRPAARSRALTRVLDADPAGAGAAMVNQVMAVVGEIAATLSAQDAELATLVAELDDVNRAHTDLELDAAVLDSRMGEAEGADRALIEPEHDAVWARIIEMRARVTDAQRRLVTRVDAVRGLGGAEVQALFAEADAALDKLRAIRSPR